jgi:hypothetical protein
VLAIAISTWQNYHMNPVKRCWPNKKSYHRLGSINIVVIITI